jgi:cell division control protein 7
MARGKTIGNGNDPFAIHDDQEAAQRGQVEYGNEITEAESEDSRAGYDSESSSDTNDAVDPVILEDIEKFNETFKGISDRYRLINRIGEGMTSSQFLTMNTMY